MTDIMNTTEAAVYLGSYNVMLHRWRQRGVGPRYTRVGAKVFLYTRQDLDAWLSTQEKSRRRVIRADHI